MTAKEKKQIRAAKKRISEALVTLYRRKDGGGWVFPGANEIDAICEAYYVAKESGDILGMVKASIAAHEMLDFDIELSVLRAG